MLVDKIHERMPKSPAMDVLMYIVSHTDPKTKIFSDSYTKIQKETKVCRQTIANTLKKLAEIDCIEDIGNGKWYNKMIDESSETYDGMEYYVKYKGQ